MCGQAGTRPQREPQGDPRQRRPAARDPPGKRPHDDDRRAARRGAGKQTEPARRGKPFRDAEACILWMIAALATGGESARRVPSAICTPGDIVKCLDTLYRRRRIDLHHVRILRLWGHRGRAPDASDPREKADWRIWREALDRLDWPLRSQGIVS